MSIKNSVVLENLVKLNISNKQKIYQFICFIMLFFKAIQAFIVSDCLEHCSRFEISGAAEHGGKDGL